MTYFFGVPPKGVDFYHIGVTVPDVHAAMDRYSAAFGFTWARLHERSVRVIVDGTPRGAEIAVTYSLEGPPYLELVQERGGSVWGADGFALTHAGFWAEDLEAAKRRLDESGLIARVHADTSGGGPMRFSYHQFATGLLIELVTTTLNAELAHW